MHWLLLPAAPGLSGDKHVQGIKCSRMTRMVRFIKVLLIVGLSLATFAGLGIVAVYAYLAPRLPDAETLREVQLQTPLRVYTKDGQLVAEFGEKRRRPYRLEEVPEKVVQAFLAAEDERFFTHPGVDWQGLTRAVMHLIRTGEKGPGGSTITMQVARNFFLGREKTYIRKLNEILLALKIERELSKNEILELYLNKIFLGQRAYGVGAAAQVYYGRPLDKLKVEQIAMIAGLPKAPSRFNPIVNPARAVTRRNYVLGRMRDLAFIDTHTFEAATAAGVTAKIYGLRVETEAPYLAEMARTFLEQRYGEQAYTKGYRVFLTIGSNLQSTANAALRKALIDYDRRHGYRGAEGRYDGDLNSLEAITQALSERRAMGGLMPAVITDVFDKAAVAVTRGGAQVELEWAGMDWARAYRSENRRGPKPKTASDVLSAGDIVRVRLEEEGWQLGQLPAVEGAFVALDPSDGAVRALSGGFDFRKSKFNRVMQAERQPGSSFKPFIYSAALSKGYSAASFINDAPVVFDDVSLEGKWMPENYSGKFFGPTRLREALYKSRNLVSIRLLQAIGIDYALSHIERFGFDVSRLPPNLSLALGSGTVKPLDIATGYAVLANGGYLVAPYFVDHIVDAGEVIFRAEPRKVCAQCLEKGSALGLAATPISLGPVNESSIDPAGRSDPSAPPEPGKTPQPGTFVAASLAGAPPGVAPRTLPATNAYIMSSMMRDVVKRGTARKALVLKRKDLAGKTGTTNDQHDAWFSGFVPGLVATAWVGFDQLKPLGKRETGGRAALPAWIEFMRVALKDAKEQYLQQPEGVVSVKIDPSNGKLAAPGDPAAEFEVFRVANAPKVQSRRRVQVTQKTEGQPAAPEKKAAGGMAEKLF